MNKKTIRKSADVPRAKRRPQSIYYIMAALKRKENEPKDNAHMDSSTEIWIRAKQKPAAVASARRKLAAQGWRIKKINVAAKVTPGFARIGAMMDPPVYTEEEADEWTEQYRIAETHDFSCVITHFKAAHPHRSAAGV